MRSIKLLGLSLYGPLAASSRYRLGNYIPGLSKNGIELKIQYLLGDEYLHSIFHGGHVPVLSLARSGWERLGLLIKKGQYDVVFLHCELLPFIPAFLEEMLLSIPYIYDFDDAFYLKYRIGKYRAARYILGDKFDAIMERAAAVTAGNRHLAQYAKNKNKNTFILPTSVDTIRYGSTARLSNDIFTIGWIGSPSTAPYLTELVSPLSLFGKEVPLRLVVIGGKAPVIPNIDIVELDWCEGSEVSIINTLDVGVMPLPNNEWAKGKCAFKLIQYMACGVPVIASNVGANKDVVTNDCGFLVSDVTGWMHALRSFQYSPNLRLQMGQASRERIEKNYSLQNNIPILSRIIHDVVSGLN